MQTFKKYLPWILAVVFIALFVVYFDKFNKAKAANKSLTDGAIQSAVESHSDNTGIAGGLASE